MDQFIAAETKKAEAFVRFGLFEFLNQLEADSKQNYISMPPMPPIPPMPPPTPPPPGASSFGASAIMASVDSIKLATES